MNFTLNDLPVGRKARILNIHESDAKIKLMELGCVPSAIISMKRKAPLGGPLAIEIAGYLLSMRVNEAKNIEIELITD